MVRLIHAADFHLDSPFSGLDPEQAIRRRAEQRELLGRLAELARDRNAELVLLAGDLFDAERVFQETAKALAQHLESIPCPVLIAPGNHDFYSGRSPYATLRWPENVHIFTSGQLEGVSLPQLNCTVYGAAFTAPRQDSTPLHGFQAQGDGMHLMVLHGQTGVLNEYGPIAPQDIQNSGLTYLALGHVHQYSGLNREGGTFWAYPGCPEGRGFDELGDKGVLYIEAEPGNCRAEFVPLAKRRYQIFDIDVTGAENVLQAIEAQLPAGTQEDICRLRLTGERGLDRLDLEDFGKKLAGRFYGVQLRDHTRLAQDLWARLEEDSLTGLFLQEMDRRRRQDPDSGLVELAVRFGLAALERGEDAAP